MRIVHIGPPLERTGGPAGYLMELSSAAESAPSREHDVVFPELAPSRPPSTPEMPLASVARRWKRAFFGKPSFYRPSDDEIRRSGGPMATLLRDSARAALESASASLERARSEQADVFFVHDAFAGERALDGRGHAEVWLFVHAPMPSALYLAWCWGRPDLTWEETAALPDVRRGVEEELQLWKSVDRIVLPSREALDELSRVDARFGEVKTPVEYVLTGSSVGAGGTQERERTGEITGLFLGNAQPYRGLEVLLQALELLPDRKALPGRLLAAGPAREALPSHPRLRPLGRVGDVPALLATVDFVVNTNRFSLFDLSNIEAAAAGKALLLHATGGNRTLERLGVGCRSFSELTPETVAKELEAMFSTPRGELDALGRASRECYEKHLTADKMWTRHLELYDRVAVRRPREMSAPK